MSYLEEEKIPKAKKPKKIYSFQELEDFDKELEPFRIDGERDGRKLKYLAVGGEFAYLKKHGIIEAWQEIKLDMKGLSHLPAWRIKDDEEYREHENKMSQYWNWKDKNDYIFNQNIEEYEKVAKEF